MDPPKDLDPVLIAAVQNLQRQSAARERPQSVPNSASTQVSTLGGHPASTQAIPSGPASSSGTSSPRGRQRPSRGSHNGHNGIHRNGQASTSAQQSSQHSSTNSQFQQYRNGQQPPGSQHSSTDSQFQSRQKQQQSQRSSTSRSSSVQSRRSNGQSQQGHPDQVRPQVILRGGGTFNGQYNGKGLPPHMDSLPQHVKNAILSQPKHALPPKPKGTDALSGGVALGTAKGYSSDVAVVLCTGIPKNTTQRIFRKKIGYAVHATFTNVPTFKTFLKMNKGTTEYGTVLFPNSGCADTFLRAYGKSNGPQIEINKIKIRCVRASADGLGVTPQEAAALHWRPTDSAMRAQSDYEDDDEDKPMDVFIHHCEIGYWDSQGRFVAAWKSADIVDRYSTLDMDGDSARLSARLGDQIIRFSLYHVDHIIIQEKDVYISASHLPTYLRDVSQGYTAMRRTVGLMNLRGSAFEPKLIRLPCLDESHAKVAPFCYAVKIRCENRHDLDAFLQRWQRKLIDLVDYREIRRNDKTPYKSSWLRKLEAWYPRLSFQLAFQAQALLYDAKLTPQELYELRGTIERLHMELSAVTAAQLLREAATSLPHRSPGEAILMDAKEFARGLEKQMERIGQTKISIPGTYAETGYFDIHGVAITPAGLLLDGPHRDAGNRIVRQYPGYEEFFLRVRLQDENGGLLRDSFDVNHDDAIFSGKFRDVFVNGLTVGGRHFTFLAFSTSSLREHSTWFVADFEYQGRAVTAQKIRDDIGELQSIRIPAKFAARMGQAFTTTSFAIQIPTDRIHRIEDVNRNEYTFSDGCGTLTLETMQALHAKDKRRRRNRRKNAFPSVFQIRIGGAKGVLSLNLHQDPKYQVIIRNSMAKFSVNTDNKTYLDLEVAASADSPLTTNLNRPLVALLETLGVPAKNFISIQDTAVAELREAVTDTIAALKLYRSCGYGAAAETADLLQTLNRVLDLDGITDIPFLKRCNMTCLTASLRQIKYKARCRVDQAWTLMGVMDESGWLRPGQIYVQIKQGENQETQFLEGDCIIGRSPYLAPGDIQRATLVGRPPAGSYLEGLHNCVVFSQLGGRPLPNMLAGGDLDGDLYNVIQNPLLFPKRVSRPGRYISPPTRQLDRECDITDIINFFLVYCQTDRLGMIADRHLNISDRSHQGVEDHRCIKLAELASVAVDYQKTGIAPELSSIPRLKDNAKPDYFQNEHRLESRTMHRRSCWARDGTGYYKTEKALGQLFRRIDVNADIDKWGKRAPAPKDPDEIKKRYWAKIRPWLPSDWLAGGPDYDMIRVQSFYTGLDNIAQQYAPERRREALSEEEIFMGVILSRFGSSTGSNSRAYNAQTGLRDDFSELIDSTLTNFCDTDEWNVPTLTTGLLRELQYADAPLHAKLQRLKEIRESVIRTLHGLARWILAAELFERSKAPAINPVKQRKVRHGPDGEVIESAPTPPPMYESAKWIAIGPALKKVEELDMSKEYERLIEASASEEEVLALKGSNGRAPPSDDVHALANGLAGVTLGAAATAGHAVNPAFAVPPAGQPLVVPTATAAPAGPLTEAQKELQAIYGAKPPVFKV